MQEETSYARTVQRVLLAAVDDVDTLIAPCERAVDGVLGARLELLDRKPALKEVVRHKDVVGKEALGGHRIPAQRIEHASTHRHAAEAHNARAERLAALVTPRRDHDTLSARRHCARKILDEVVAIPDVIIADDHDVVGTRARGRLQAEVPAIRRGGRAPQHAIGGPPRRLQADAFGERTW